jgi:hypothetical protein
MQLNRSARAVHPVNADEINSAGAGGKGNHAADSIRRAVVVASHELRADGRRGNVRIHVEDRVESTADRVDGHQALPFGLQQVGLHRASHDIAAGGAAIRDRVVVIELPVIDCPDGNRFKASRPGRGLKERDASTPAPAGKSAAVFDGVGLSHRLIKLGE